MRLELIESPDLSEAIPFTEKYIKTIKKRISHVQDIDIKKIILEKLKPEEADKTAREALLKLNLIWDETEIDLLIILLSLSENVSNIINVEGVIFEQEVIRKLEGHHRTCARLHFIKRVAETVFEVLNNINIGTRDIGEVTYKLMLISKFSYSYCSDMVIQLTNSLVTVPGLNAELEGQKSH
jgi:hypothetical protein